MTKHLTFDQDGKLNGRYDSEFNTTIPETAVLVSEETFLQTINLTTGYWELVDGVITYTIPPPPQDPIIEAPTASELIAAAHARINADYDAAVDAMTAGYPKNEIASWPKQEREARAWNTAPTPWIDAAAEARGISKIDLVTAIIGNADALAPAHGALTGKRQKLRDQIDALGANPTEAQLAVIQW